MDKDRSFLNRHSLAGFGATFIGVGMGRFAYIALIPVLIQAGWFSDSEAAYLGAATLIGYIFGAPAASFLLRYFAAGQLIRLAMLIGSLSYLGCAFEQAPLGWFYLWRTLAGVSGAVLMVLAPPEVLKSHDKAVKAKVSGVVFSGLGFGAMLSGTLVPALIDQSIQAAWLGLGGSCLLVTIFTWRSWDCTPSHQTSGIIQASFKILSRPQRYTLALIALAYGCNALGYLPHTLFWVDYIVRELNHSFSQGGFYWSIFGIGAAIGPVLAGICGDKFGVRNSLLLTYSLKAGAVALPLLSNQPVALFISSLMVGVLTPASVSLISTYTLEAVGYELHTKAWAMVTLAFAVAQGVGGYAMAYYASQLTSYAPLFMFGSVALAISLLAIYLSVSSRQQPTSKLGNNKNEAISE